MYSVLFSKKAVKQLKSLPKNAIKRIVEKIDSLQKEPRPRECKKLVGENNLWRIRIGDYRVIYTIKEDILIVKIT